MIAPIDIPGYAQGWRFSDAPDYYDGAGRFFDLSPYRAWGTQDCHLVAGSPVFETADGYRALRLDNTSHYQGYENDTEKRSIMRAASQGRPIYGEFKAIDSIEESGQLFPRGDTYMTKNENNVQINVGGSITGQTTISGVGTATTQGNATTGVVGSRAELFEELRCLLQGAPIDTALLNETIAKLDEAEKEGSRDRFNEAVGLLAKCEAALKSLNGMGDLAMKIGAKVTLLGAAIGLA